MQFEAMQKKTIVSQLSLASGCQGGSEGLPRSGDSVGVQASCCLSPTLVLGPGDQVPGEFRMREPIRNFVGEAYYARLPAWICP